MAATLTSDGPAGAEAGWRQPELFAVVPDPVRAAARATRRTGQRPSAEAEVLPLIWPDPPGLIRGARYRREVVRLSAAGRARAGGLLHIERPPMLVDGQRLDFTFTALCGAGLAATEQRTVGLAKQATCRRCRGIARQLPNDTRLVYPLYRVDLALQNRLTQTTERTRPDADRR